MSTPPSPENFFHRTRASRLLNSVQLPQIFICFLVIVLYVLLLGTGKMERAENNMLDFFLRHQKSAAVHPDLVLIEIDKDSLEAIGPWPWPWKYFAELFQVLSKWEAKAIVLEFIFNKPASHEQEKELEESFRNGRFYFPVSLDYKAGKKFYIHSMPIVLEPENEKKSWTHSLASLEKHARAVGHTNLIHDEDGVVRRIQPYLPYGQEAHLYLPIKAVYEYLGEDIPGPAHLDLPVDFSNRLMIQWPGPWADSYKRYSVSNVIRSAQAYEKGIPPAVGPDKIRGKICLVGITVPEIASFKVTPVESSVPPLAIHAAVTNNLLTGNFLKPASFTLNALCLCLAGFFASLIFIALRSLSSFFAALILGAGWLAGTFWILHDQGLWIYAIQPVLLILTLWSVSAIYNQILLRKEKNRLFDLATRDGLTGLYVIRHFREILNKVVLETQLKKQPLSVILIDIDNFKKINDTYGHPAGDMVLKKTAEVISACFRTRRPIHELDFAARYGGEEIIVMIRNIPLKEAAFKVAERIRKAVENAHFEWEGQVIKVTISLGVATIHPGENIPDLMVRRADEALYRAKRAGKNQVCIETVAG